MTTQNAAIDIEGLVEALGGFKELAKKLTNKGVNTPEKTVQKWIERKSITGDRIAQLLALAKEEGVKIDMTKFIIDEKIK